MPRLPNSISQDRAEEYLIESGASTRPSPQLRAVLGCLACRWRLQAISNSESRPYGTQIAQCTGAEVVTVRTILDRLHRHKLIAVTKEAPNRSDLNRAPRSYYAPVATQAGEAFVASLVIPPVCGLDAKPVVEEDDSNQETHIPLDRRADILEILGSSPTEDLAQIIATSSWITDQATKELISRNAVDATHIYPA